MTELTFAKPEWFWGLLLLLPLLALRVWTHLTMARQLPGLVSPRLQKHLISGNSQAQRWVIFVLQALAITSTIVALARPLFGFDEVEAETEARNLIVAIDTSRSMLANDLAPNRLERAKLASMDIVQSLPDDRIGLIAFAGRPFLQAPLTVDHEAILESIAQLDTEIIPRGGTNLSAAAKLALDTFEESDLEQSALVIFSDGEALEGLEEVQSVRESANAAGMSIIAVGVGTSGGAIIPELDQMGNPVPGVFVKDETGQVVRSRLDPVALQSLAKNGGVYIHLGGKASLTQVVEQIQSGIATSRTESEASLRPIERFMWPLSGAVLFLILAHLVPMLWLKPATSSAGLPTLSSTQAIVLLTLLGSPLSLQADDALFVGHESFVNKEYEAAIEAYEGALAEEPSPDDASRLRMGIGASAFRQGDFERAAEAYGEALVDSAPQLREHAHYNLGNTLYRQGESSLKSLQKPANPDQLQTLSAPDEVIDATIRRWESAIEHYESALSLNKENEKATHNIEVIKKRIEDLQKQQEEQKKQEQQEEDDEKNKEDQEKEEDEKEQEDEKEAKDENQQENQEDQEEKQDDTESEQEKQEDQSGENEEQEEEGEQEPEENPDEQNDSEKKGDGEKGEDEQPSEPEDPSEGEGDENKNAPSDSQQNQPQPEQPDNSAPEDGKLEANPNESQPAQPQQMNPGEIKRNPETGYSPSEARQLLKALADETEVRPILKPSRGEKFKNW